MSGIPNGNVAGVEAEAAGSSATGSVTVKTEKRARLDDAEDNGEYDEWAKRLVSRPIPQMVTGTPQIQLSNSSVNSFLLQSATGGNGPGTNTTTSVTIGSDGLPPHKGFDIDSAIGRFTWHTVEEDKYIPCLFRSGDKYCCIRMIEVSILGNYLTSLPQDIYDAAKLNSHFATSAEAKLLTYINTWHCDGFYGAEQFTTSDLVVSLAEMEKFYTYLVFAYNVLQSGGKNRDNDFSKCGFVRVNQDSLIPYTVLSPVEKGVPLFYFEGQIDILKEKASPYGGWELAYLKICCKVQGVRKDLMSGETLQIIKLTDLRSYFPKRTVFQENCWPQTKGKSLLPKQHHLSLGYYSGHSTISQNSVPCSRWTRNVPNEEFNQSKSNQNSLSTRTIVNVSNNGITQHLNTTGLSFSNNVGTLGNQIPRQFTFMSNSSTPMTMTHSAATTQFFQRNGMTMGMGPSASMPVSMNTPHSAASQIIPFNNSNPMQMQVPRNQVVTKSVNLAKIKAIGPPVELSRLSPIPEHPDGSRDGAYTVRMIIIDKEFMHCINHKPFKTDGYLIVLQEFIMKFFPSVSLYPTCVSVLKNIGISTYLPNSTQVKIFNAFGFSIQRVWEIPLISAQEAAQQITRIRSLLTPKPTTMMRPRTQETNGNVSSPSAQNVGPRTARVAPNGYSTSSSYYTGR